MPKKAREALVTYLGYDMLQKPVAVTSAVTTESPVGFVDVNFVEGSLFLKDQNDRTYRLFWGKPKEGTEEGEEASDRRRALPTGKYTVTSYRVIDRSSDDVWHIAATSLLIERIEVTADLTTKVEIERSIGIGSRLTQEEVSLTIQGKANSGLTIYKNGKRIPIDWKIVDGDGRELQSGSINYG